MTMKVTQNYRLATLLQSGSVVSKDEIVKTLGVDQYSVPVYIHELKRLYKAEIKSVRNGRKVIGYQLTNKIKVPQYRSNNAQVEKVIKPVVVDGALPVLDPGTTVFDEREMLDVKDSLGLGNASYQE